MPASLRKKLLLMSGSLVACLLLFAMAELLCRAASDIAFRGNSRGLFVANAYGSSMGNAKNATNISAGIEVFTDEFGFRVPRPAPETPREQGEYESSLLILGDSVGFGAGVEEDKTFAGLLRAGRASTRIYNSSVIGYYTYDYKNVIDHFSLAEKYVDKVVLVYCLNDVTAASAQQVKEYLAPPGDSVNSDVRARPAKIEIDDPGLFEALRGIDLLSKINETLRSRSKLYLLTISLLADPRPRYWAAAYRLYEESNALGFEQSMSPLGEIAEQLARQGVGFKVIIVPYSPQLESDEESAWLPQQKLTEYFSSHEIDYLDARAEFKRYSGNPNNLFLPFDPVHLSKKGHQLLYSVVTRGL